MKKTTSVLTVLASALLLASCGGGSSGGGSGGSGSGTSGGSTGSSYTPPVANYDNKTVINYEAIVEAPDTPAKDLSQYFPTEPYRKNSRNGSTYPKFYGAGAQYRTNLKGEDPDRINQALTYRPTEAFFKNEMRPVDTIYHLNNYYSLEIQPDHEPYLKVTNRNKDLPYNEDLLFDSIRPYANYLTEKTVLTPVEAPTIATPNTEGNLTANRADALLDKVNPEYAKVLVIDTDLTTVSPQTEKLVNEGRIEVVYARDKKDNETAATFSSFSHAERDIGNIINGFQADLTKSPDDTSTKDDADFLLQPLFAKKGSVKLITAFKGSEDPALIRQEVYHNKSKVLEEAIDTGYNIISESFSSDLKEVAELFFGIKEPDPGEKITTLEDFKVPKDYLWLFNNQILKNKLDLGQIFYRYLDKVNNYSFIDYAELVKKAILIYKKDALFVKALGNDKNDFSSAVIGVDNYSSELIPLLDGYIGVTAYTGNEASLTAKKDDPNFDDFLFNDDGTRKQYATPCSHIKLYCLAAYDVVSLENGNAKQVQSSIGTSYSAPYVASVAALVKSVFPFMHNSELQQTVLTTAKDIGEKGIDDVYGWGLVQPQVAVNGPKAIFRNFVVDFDYRRKPNDNNPVYEFSNPIQAYRLPAPKNNAVTLTAEQKAAIDSLQLIVKNPGVLVLSNHNPFDGLTMITDGATVDLTGSIQGEVFINENSHLYSQGLADTVTNTGHVYNYNRDRGVKYRSQEIKNLVNGCSVNNLLPGCNRITNGNSVLYIYRNFENPVNKNFKVNNYLQDAGATLHLYTGDPLLVTNQAEFRGRLSIDGFRELYRFSDNPRSLYGLVILSSNPIKGSFSSMSYQDTAFISTNFATITNTNETHTDPNKVNLYRKTNIDGKVFYYYLINFNTGSLRSGFTSLNLNSSQRALAKDGLENLSALEAKVEASEQANTSAISAEEKGKLLDQLVASSAASSVLASNLDTGNGIKASNSFNSLGTSASTSTSTLHSTSALSSFLTGLKLSSASVAKDTLFAFSGSEYSRAFRNNQALSAFNTNELWVDHGHQQGLTSSYTFQQALANQHYTARSNRLALAYGTADYHLLGALNYSNSSWDNPLSLGKSSSDHKGLNLLASYNYQGYNFGLGLDYNHHHNKVRRELNILGKAYNFTQSLAHDSLDLAFLLAKDLEVNNFLTVSPYLALSYEYHKLGAFQESFSTGGQDFTLGSQAKHYSFVSPLAGVKFYKTINNHLDLLANFSYKFLPKGEVKAQLADQSHNIEQSFSYDADHLFAIKGGLNYHFNKALTLDVKGGVKKLSSYNGWTKELSVKLSYNFFE